LEGHLKSISNIGSFNQNAEISEKQPEPLLFRSIFGMVRGKISLGS
jgi:hypothetical protein